MKKLTMVLYIAAMFFPAMAEAHQEGDFIVRAGSATVRPTGSSTRVMGLGHMKADNDTQLGLNFGYMVTDNMGVELLAATPFNHTVHLSNVGNIASIRQLPPTLMAQWYFGDREDSFRPYIGAGINYTTFYHANFNGRAQSLGLHDLSAEHSWGGAGQIGADYLVNDNWLINASIWYLGIDTTVHFRDGNNKKHSYNMDIDPLVFMFSTGLRF